MNRIIVNGEFSSTHDHFTLQDKLEDPTNYWIYASKHLDQSQEYWKNYFNLSSEYYHALNMLIDYPAEVAKKPARFEVT